MDKGVKKSFNLQTNQHFCKVNIQFPSEEDIISWTNRLLPETPSSNEKSVPVGQITFPGTINYKTKVPIPGGLLCEKTFGPQYADSCTCGEVIRVMRRNAEGKKPEHGRWTCPICGGQWGDPRLRRYQMGYIKLRRTVVHPWVLYSTPNYLALLMKVRRTDIQQLAWCNTVISLPFAAYNQSKSYLYSNSGRWSQNMASWDNFKITEFDTEKKLVPIGVSGNSDLFKSLNGVKMPPVLETNKSYGQISKNFYSNHSPSPTNLPTYSESRQDMLFVPCTGGTAVRSLLESLNLFQEEQSSVNVVTYIHNLLNWSYGITGFSDAQMRLSDARLIDEQITNIENLLSSWQYHSRRLRLIRHLIQNKASLSGLTISLLPVLPPVFRPFLELPNGGMATSDINTLYRHVLVRNLKLSTMGYNGAPDLDAFLLQESIDRLFDNTKAPRPMYPRNDLSPWAKCIKIPKPPLKSLSDGLKGKQGRFRQHLLGKRVDYSGRSVITSGPELQLTQCGVPLEMAVELFQSWLLAYLCGGAPGRQTRLVGSLRQAKHILQHYPNSIWHLVEFFLSEQGGLLNRAPTLHRFGIQAFEPVLVPGRAILLHPLVCPAFNADFDGDQMALHVPVSLETHTEARIILLAAQNFLTPSTGEPILSLSQDMILGCYYLTSDPQNFTSHYGRRCAPVFRSEILFGSLEEVSLMYYRGVISLHSWVWIRWKQPFTSWLTKEEPIEVRIGARGSRIEIYRQCQCHYNRWGVLVDQYLQTTVGRVLLNQVIMPVDLLNRLD